MGRHPLLAGFAVATAMILTGCSAEPPRVEPATISLDVEKANWMIPGYADGFDEVKFPESPALLTLDNTQLVGRTDIEDPNAPKPEPTPGVPAPLPKGTTTIMLYQVKDSSPAWKNRVEVSYLSPLWLTKTSLWALREDRTLLVELSLKTGEQISAMKLGAEEKVSTVFDLGNGHGAIMISGTKNKTPSKLVGPKKAWTLPLPAKTGCAQADTVLACTSPTKNSIVNLETGKITRDLPARPAEIRSGTVLLKDGFAYEVEGGVYAVLRTDGTDTGERVKLDVTPAPAGLYAANDLVKMQSMDARPAAVDAHGKAVVWAKREPLAALDTLYDANGTKVGIAPIVAVDRDGTYLASGILRTPKGNVIFDRDGIGTVGGRLIVRNEKISETKVDTYLLVPRGTSR